MAALDESFFRVRFDRLTPTEKKYLRAMAELGAGPHRSGDIAEQLGRGVSSLGPTRAGLNRQRYDLEPYSRRHGIHRPSLRRINEADYARKRLEAEPVGIHSAEGNQIETQLTWRGRCRSAVELPAA